VFTDASVGVTGEATLISRGFIVTDNIQELVPSVDMVIEVTQANYERATAAIYNPHFELTQITSEGENTLNIVYSSQAYGQVISCEPNTVTVHAERYITRRVPVVVELSGTMPEGYYLKSYKADPLSLSVSGPQNLVSTVTRVVVHLDQSDLSGERPSDRMSLAIELQQSDGTTVNSEKLTVTNQSVITNSLIVETELSPLKSLPLDAKAFVTGTPAEGYKLKHIELAEESIPVAGASEILDALTVITTDAPLDITDATESMSGYVRLRRLTGIDSTLPTEIGVTAVIEEETLTRRLQALSIGVRGQTSQKVTLMPDVTNVAFTGPYSFIKELDGKSVSLYVDVTGLEEGTHVLPLQIEIDNASAFAAKPETGEIKAVITIE